MSGMRKEVKRILVIKEIGFSLYFISLIPMYLTGKQINIFTIILIVLATILLLLFRCPYCKKRLDPRLKIVDIKCCPMCSHKFYQ